MKKRISAIAMFTLGLASFLPAAHAAAATTDQVPIVTHTPAVIHPGDVVHFDVTNLPADVTKTNGYLTYTNQRTHKTNYWAQLGTGRDYTADIDDVGKTLVASFCYGVPTYPGSRLVKQICGTDYIQVTDTAAVAPTTLMVGGSCHAYLNGSHAAYAYCSQNASVGYKSMFLQIRCQDGTYRQGVKVYNAFDVSQASCGGLIVTSYTFYLNLYS